MKILAPGIIAFNEKVISSIQLQSFVIQTNKSIEFINQIIDSIKSNGFLKFLVAIQSGSFNLMQINSFILESFETKHGKIVQHCTLFNSFSILWLFFSCHPILLKNIYIFLVNDVRADLLHVFPIFIFQDFVIQIAIFEIRKLKQKKNKNEFVFKCNFFNHSHNKWEQILEENGKHL